MEKVMVFGLTNMVVIVLAKHTSRIPMAQVNLKYKHMSKSI